MSVTIRCIGETAVQDCGETAHAFAADAGLAPAPTARLAIIVEELVANLVEHGEVGDEGAVELTLRRAADGALSLILIDGGKAFDPRSAERGGAIPERGGGAGLEIVRSWSDIRDYRRQGDYNRLELDLRID